MLKSLRSGARPLFVLPLLAIAVGIALGAIALTGDSSIERPSDGGAAIPPGSRRTKGRSAPARARGWLPRRRDGRP